jgi:hypothetical protein
VQNIFYGICIKYGHYIYKKCWKVWFEKSLSPCIPLPVLGVVGCKMGGSQLSLMVTLLNRSTFLPWGWFSPLGGAYRQAEGSLFTPCTELFTGLACGLYNLAFTVSMVVPVLMTANTRNPPLENDQPVRVSYIPPFHHHVIRNRNSIKHEIMTNRLLTAFHQTLKTRSAQD